MIINEANSIQISFIEKIKALIELLKLRLSLLVAFSGAFGYLLGHQGEVSWRRFTLFIISGIILTGASNIVNQVKEIESDKLMKRTSGRPLPTGKVSVQEAIILCTTLLIISLFVFAYYINVKTALLGLLSFFLYGFVYTPLKKVGPIAVIVGAFPGALPPMIGWVAATNQFGWEPGILFAIQFFWQFPHFWAIAWVGDTDYRRAGFKLLPAKGQKDFDTAVQIMIYTLFLLPLSWLPYYLNMSGINSAFIAMVCGVLFLAQTFHLMRQKSDKAALQIMFGSFVYLPIVQIAFLWDKI